ncbi:MAG: hypothetical protein MUF87_21345 [Anaerolineae bacterium]|jgi:hypothetical protein|nr:hypothetical protein [Anaerolineae bacterium]
MKKNEWIVNGRRTLAEWQVTLNPMEDLETTVNSYWAFWEYLLLQAKTERIFGIVADFYDADHQPLDYLSYCKMKYHTENKLNLFSIVLRSTHEFPFQQEVCCYNLDGEVERFTTRNLGGLLESLRPDIQSKDTKLDFMPCIIGLRIDQPRPLVGLSSIEKEPIRIGIELTSSIWFPKVLDKLNEKLVKEYSWMDNGELADCNTPRLNRFLLNVREKALEMKSGWELVEPKPYFRTEKYKEMVSVDGIII